MNARRIDPIVMVMTELICTDCLTDNTKRDNIPAVTLFQRVRGVRAAREGTPRGHHEYSPSALTRHFAPPLNTQDCHTPALP